MSGASASASPDRGVAGCIDQMGDLAVTTVVVDSDRANVHVRGEMDASNADLLAVVLDNQLSLGRRFIRLDVSRLDFLDCGGLRAIVRGHNQCLRAHGTLVLVGLTPRIARMLRLSHLDEALFVADGIEAPPRRQRQHLSAIATQ